MSYELIPFYSIKYTGDAGKTHWSASRLWSRGEARETRAVRCEAQVAGTIIKNAAALLPRVSRMMDFQGKPDLACFLLIILL